jgi:hypothetical protein
MLTAHLPPILSRASSITRYSTGMKNRFSTVDAIQSVRPIEKG